MTRAPPGPRDRSVSRRHGRGRARRRTPPPPQSSDHRTGRTSSFRDNSRRPSSTWSRSRPPIAATAAGPEHARRPPQRPGASPSAPPAACRGERRSAPARESGTGSSPLPSSSRPRSARSRTISSVIQRIAVRRSRIARSASLGDAVRDQRRDEPPVSCVRQRRKVDLRRDSRLDRPSWLCDRRARRAVQSDEQRHPFDALGEIGQEVEQRKVRPVQILDHDHRGPVRDRLEEPAATR